MHAQPSLRGLAFGGIVAAALALLPSAAFCDTVGAAAAVKPSSTGTPPGGSARTLQVGSDIVAQERIDTTASGSLQVMFLDKSTLTVGPNSNLVIDQFVYNANAGTGQFAANLTKGALRFVGGQISHTNGVTINTPAATIGIRGGSGVITHGRCDTGECTKFACTGGICTYKSKFGSSDEVQVRLNEVVNITMSVTNEPPVDAEIVNMNRIASGGNPVVAGTNNGGQNQGSASIEALTEELATQQQPEPSPPPAN
jgi:hypothetical protein